MVSCLRCQKSHSGPQAFLLTCSECKRSWHHRCHIPPIQDDELLRRIRATNADDTKNGLDTWICKKCTKDREKRKGQSESTSTDASTSREPSTASTMVDVSTSRDSNSGPPSTATDSLNQSISREQSTISLKSESDASMRGYLQNASDNWESASNTLPVDQKQSNVASAAHLPPVPSRKTMAVPARKTVPMACETMAVPARKTVPMACETVAVPARKTVPMACETVAVPARKTVPMAKAVAVPARKTVPMAKTVAKPARKTVPMACNTAIVPARKTAPVASNTATVPARKIVPARKTVAHPTASPSPTKQIPDIRAQHPVPLAPLSSGVSPVQLSQNARVLAAKKSASRDNFQPSTMLVDMETQTQREKAPVWSLQNTQVLAAKKSASQDSFRSDAMLVDEEPQTQREEKDTTGLHVEPRVAPTTHGPGKLPPSRPVSDKGSSDERGARSSTTENVRSTTPTGHELPASAPTVPSNQIHASNLAERPRVADRDSDGDVIMQAHENSDSDDLYAPRGRRILYVHPPLRAHSADDESDTGDVAGERPKYFFQDKNLKGHLLPELIKECNPAEEDPWRIVCSRERNGKQGRRRSKPQAKMIKAKPPGALLDFFFVDAWALEH